MTPDWIFCCYIGTYLYIDFQLSEGHERFFFPTNTDPIDYDCSSLVPPTAYQ